MTVVVSITVDKDTKELTLNRYEKRTDRLAKLFDNTKLKKTHHASAPSPTPAMVEEFRMRPPAKFAIPDGGQSK